MSNANFDGFWVNLERASAEASRVIQKIPDSFAKDENDLLNSVRVSIEDHFENPVIAEA